MNVFRLDLERGKRKKREMRKRKGKNIRNRIELKCGKSELLWTHTHFFTTKKMRENRIVQKPEHEKLNWNIHAA